MRKQKFYLWVFIFAIMLTPGSENALAQCSICTRTAQQLGEKPAKGLNAGIIYLALTPLLLIGFIGYKAYKKYNNSQD